MKSTVLFLSLLFSLAFSFDEDIEYYTEEGNEIENSHITTVFRSKRQEGPGNATTVSDHHVYYRSQYISRGDSYWFELKGREGVNETAIQELFRYYVVWRMPFPFPFYGHILDRIAVSTGGFLYTGTFYHSQIHLTQFIAPLQANFNPSLNDTAKILVYSTANRFTVQWEGVHNDDHINDGEFTFQVSLFPDGTIHFAYREIPLPINKINNDEHPVEVGLADSFYVDVIDRFGRIIRYIYEYSRIQLNKTQELSNTAYVITPVPNCIIANSCESCSNISKQGIFNCAWCANLSRCSDGIDRHRQEWFIAGCHNQAVSTCQTSTVRPISSTRQIFTPSFLTSSPPLPTITSGPPQTTTPPRTSLSTGAEVGIGLVAVFLLVLIILVVVIGGVVLYLRLKRPVSGPQSQVVYKQKKGEQGLDFPDDTDGFVDKDELAIEVDEASIL
ncbi:PREDICTED: plexin domain-containing protein 2-like isoform X2 [Amphimedon queenslandica]|uniref:PSI domain-containing protein n=1 Tax=Amphimedon queenslandica TaxID=400682 RepID=A0AAN0K4I9_AMPQE|nr:PREDICTED: plexin domain-containing protein 2-like isoform X2 [Amphimedon queenslandica]|eukprot:XP_019864237.1 PREDICTED: plexin domain-containing protein 2-like isoform X2 [Amphimedon queenslandica]